VDNLLIGGVFLRILFILTSAVMAQLTAALCLASLLVAASAGEFFLASFHIFVGI
jgi:hypothetical protein